MEVIHNLNFQFADTAVCIGKFDGIHKGHRLLLSEAKKEGQPLVMFTFSSTGDGLLYTQEEKYALAEKLGVDVLIDIPLDHAFMQQSPEDFVLHILREKCGAVKVVVGSDFRFGYQRRGDVKMLASLGEKYDFSVVVMDKIRDVCSGEIISSTYIRQLIGEGELLKANRLLETPYFFCGRVQSGNHIGRQMSTPTANLYPAEQKVLPPYGVYAVTAKVGQKCYNGVCNLGVKPTIPGDNPIGLEVWLFDFEGDLYDCALTVSLMAYIRPERKFDSLRQLKDQIQKDSRQAREILSGQGI
jgi:riboflavin kinase/FMN adenylyltransferase